MNAKMIRTSSEELYHFKLACKLRKISSIMTDDIVVLSILIFNRKINDLLTELSYSGTI